LRLRGSIKEQRIFECLQHHCCSAGACLSAFCLGVSSTLFLPELISFRILGASLVIATLLALWARPYRVVVFLLLGLLWATQAFSLHLAQPFPDRFETLDIVITGTVVDLPSQHKGDWKFRFRVDDTKDRELKTIIGKQIQLSCYRCPFSVLAGQQWAFTVRLKRPHGYASPGAFDYEKFLFRQQIVARGYVRTKNAYELRGRHGFRINRWRESIKSQLQALGDDVGINMIRALTIGDKSGFTQTQKRVFQETGISHLMAISGLHIGLVFFCVNWLLKWLLWPIAGIFDRCPRSYLILLPSMLVAITYAALAGFAVSTQRALIMLSVFVLCRLFTRDVSLFRVLLIAVTLLLIYDPFSVLDIGFWLSAGAVFVIALFAVEDESLLRLQPRLWFGMLPMTSLFFGQVSLISPLVNLVLVPLFCMILIPLVLLALLLMHIGAQELGLSFFELLSVGFNWIYEGLLRSTRWSYARWYTTPFVAWQWALVCVIIGLELARYKWRILIWVLLFGSLFADTSKPIAEDQLTIALLDVGQGLAMVIRTSESVTVYDTGPRYGSGFSAAEAVLLPYLRHHGIAYIDRLIISHADNDHIGGLDVLLGQMDVGHVLTSRVDKIPQAQNCITGQNWSIERTVFSVISPDVDTPNGSNNRSCVLKIEHEGTQILISGDIEKPVERYLLRKHLDDKSALSADILLVPHQGSKTSSTADFLHAVRPRLALVAAGYRNHYGHPHPDVVGRYAQDSIKLLSTIDSGTIELSVNKLGWRASSYRVSHQRFWHYQKVSNQ